MKQIRRKLVIAAILAATAHSAAAMAGNGQDAAAEGSQQVVQKVESRTPDGEQVLITQRLTPTPDGKMRYRYAEQSKETQLYHQLHCLEIGGTPAQGDTLVGSGSTGGFACEMKTGAPAKAGVTIDGIFYENSSSDSSEPSARLPPLLANDLEPDYVTSAAPRGIVPVGENVLLSGSVRYVTSNGGTGKAKLSVDGERCHVEQSTPTTPYSVTDVQMQVNCIFYEQRAVPSASQGCINVTCANDTGSLDAISLP